MWKLIIVHCHNKLHINLKYCTNTNNYILINKYDMIYIYIYIYVCVCVCVCVCIMNMIVK